jgi:hypothetical protein
MVINNLNIFWPLASPYKAHPELIVYTNAVLSGAIMFQCFQSITGGYSKIVENTCPVKLLKFSSRHRFDSRKSFYAMPFK